jgi:hypothetical protein
VLLLLQWIDRTFMNLLTKFLRNFGVLSGIIVGATAIGVFLFWIGYAFGFYGVLASFVLLIAGLAAILTMVD